MNRLEAGMEAGKRSEGIACNPPRTRNRRDAALPKTAVQVVTLNLGHFAALYEAQKDKSATPQLEEVSAE